MKKIFIFINGGKGSDWVQGMAMCEDGTVVAQHVSSTDYWFAHDMGLTSDWKHDLYAAHCPDGFELVHVEDPRQHPELLAAYKINQAQRTAAVQAEA